MYIFCDLQWASESGRTIALASHVMTNSSVFARALLNAVDAEIVRQTFLRTVSSHPTRQTFTPAVVRITRRPVLALAVFGAKLTELSKRARYTRTIRFIYKAFNKLRVIKKPGCFFKK